MSWIIHVGIFLTSGRFEIFTLYLSRHFQDSLHDCKSPPWFKFNLEKVSSGFQESLLYQWEINCFVAFPILKSGKEKCLGLVKDRQWNQKEPRILKLISISPHSPI